MKRSTALEVARLKPLFDLLQDRLTLSDALKEKLTILTRGEQLVEAQIMDPPQSAADREYYGLLLWGNVCGRFKETLSASDLRLWGSHSADVRSSLAHVRLMKSFDDFLLAQFRHYGPALFWSHGVLQRLSEWRGNNSHWMNLLGAQLELNSRVVCGEAGARFPIGKELGALKPEVVRELRILFPKVRTEFFSKNRTAKKIASWVERVVKEQPLVFPCLNRSLPQLKMFLLTAQQEGLVLGIVTRRTHAPSFVNSWVASATGYSVQRARQEMSRSRP
jgi:hypothetical protein